MSKSSSRNLKAHDLLCRNRVLELKEFDKQTKRRYITITVSSPKLPLLDPLKTIYEWLQF
ncbi:hypothetical protein V8E54_000582 [Elaphomyces granulatus]